MAFPTTSLVNNQVHKEGNRAWVYDSTVGVWDQVSGNDTDASNLSGTLGEVTFPAGHVTQIVNNVYDSASSDQITSTSLTRFGVSSSYNWKGTINNVGASNHVIVMMSYCIETYKANTGVTGGACGIMRDTDGAGTGLATILDPKPHGNWIDINSSQSVNMYYQKTLHFVDTSPATGTNVYYLAGKIHSSSGIFAKSGSTYEPFSCTLMEIKR